jgi:hypothetical protein
MSSPGYNLTYIDGNVYYTRESLIGFGMNLGGASLSIAGCIAARYLVRHFKSLLSYSILMMNLGSALNLFFTGLAVLAIGNSQGVCLFMSWVFGMISMEFFMIQIMFRIWLLPDYARWANVTQWILFVGATGNYLVNVLCNIPINLADGTVGCYSNVMLASTGALILALDIFNSVYVIYQVTANRYHLSTDPGNLEYLDFMVRRLPILVLNMTIAVATIVFGVANFQNSYDAVDYGMALIVVVSSYYWWDLMEFAVSTRGSSGLKMEMIPQFVSDERLQDTKVLDASGKTGI